jgi:hypothetical protein
MGLQSCEKEDGVVSKDGAGTGTGGTTQSGEEATGSPLTIGSVTIGGVEIGGVVTKGTAGSLSRGIGIFRQTGAGYSGERKNVEYTNGGSGWGAATGQKAVYLTKRSATLSVYYPYDSNCSDGNKTMRSCLSSEATDLCYEKGVSAKEGTAVTFNLGHAYARVEFVFSRAEVYDGSCAISGIGISDSNGKIIKSSSLDLKSGQMSGQSYGSVNVDPGISGISTGNRATAEVLMVPTTGLGTMTLRFTVDGSEKTATVTSISELNGGKSYKINVEISASVVVQTAANCHIVALGKRISIPVTVIGNGGATAGTVPSLISSTSISPASVGIVWETATNLITLGSLSNGKVTVTAGSSAGNAVIAAYSGANQSGTILWSWHIWVTDYDPNNGGKTYSVINTGSPACTYVFMDRNLGATSAKAGENGTIGLLYQWGRKDPFTGSSSITSDVESTVYDGSGTGFKLVDKNQRISSLNNLVTSIENPEVFYKGVSGSAYDWYTNNDSSKNDALWGGSNLVTPGRKTVFDPCPAGWRVPAWSGNQSPWSALTIINFTWGNSGRTYNGSYYPAASCRNYMDGILLYTGENGYYWPAAPYVDKVYCMDFCSSSLYQAATDHSRAEGFSVRCVKE